MAYQLRASAKEFISNEEKKAIEREMCEVDRYMAIANLERLEVEYPEDEEIIAGLKREYMLTGRINLDYASEEEKGYEEPNRVSCKYGKRCHYLEGGKHCKNYHPKSEITCMSKLKKVGCKDGVKCEYKH